MAIELSVKQIILLILMIIIMTIIIIIGVKYSSQIKTIFLGLLESGETLTPVN
jgi:hypothetical protein